MAAQTDLWGEIVPAAERTPVSILREQAALLGQKTNNLVEARVDTSPTIAGNLVHTFMLVVPALGKYTYILFRVSHKLTDLYPVREMVQGEELPTERDFVDWLGRALSSSETKRVIGTLLAQVTS